MSVRPTGRRETSGQLHGGPTVFRFNPGCENRFTNGVSRKRGTKRRYGMWPTPQRPDIVVEHPHVPILPGVAQLLQLIVLGCIDCRIQPVPVPEVQ